MKRISNWALIAVLTLSSCAQEFNYDPTEEIKTNAENIFGLIDPNQDWHTTTSGTVTIIADADLSDIVKVQILTESPFMNQYAKILAETDASIGQTICLNYDAPRGTETLIASCVNSKGQHYIKPFKLGTPTVSFATTANARRSTRAESVFNASGLVLDAASTQKTFGALRTIYADLASETADPYMVKWAANKNINIWEGSKWDSETIWELSSTSNAGSSWNVVNGTIVRNTAPIDADEKATLQAIFEGYLPKTEGISYLNQHDNLQLIREGSAVRLFNTHLTSCGDPISIIPVQMASADLPKCELYYYYYNPNKIPNGITETDYIKQLPKFKAIQCDYTRSASGINKKSDIFKVHEYLLPYYGDNSLTNSGECTTDGKVYRLRNGYIRNKKTYYLTYLGEGYYNCDKMSTLIDDNNVDVANQLWQIFTTNTGKKLLYNLGSKKFITGVGRYIDDKNTWGTFYTGNKSVAKELPFDIDKLANGANRIWYNKSSGQILGANTGNSRVATNKTASDGAVTDWYFDEFTGSVNKLESLTIEGNPIAATAISDIIPNGYRVGFMLRKFSNNREGITPQGIIFSVNNGCVYGNGKLNTIINNYPGHFGQSKSVYSMQDDDPRVAMFNANNKTYLTFEDGNDCNYSDMIIEVVGNSGRLFDDIPEVDGQHYTMCFEDRPNTADYDMNDVVLSCVRESKNQVKLTLLATGAHDQVVICGIFGKLVSGTELNNKEVHELFGVSQDTFVNTEPSNALVKGISAIYEINESMTIAQFLGNIYIRNITNGGNEVAVPLKGEPPFALILPIDFNYPAEKISIVNAYTTFRNWVNNSNNYGNWPEFYDSSKIYINPNNR